MRWLARQIRRYGQAFELRGFLLSEYWRNTTTQAVYPKGLAWLIWRHPGTYEDQIQLSRFLKSDARLLLIDVGANTGAWAGALMEFFPSMSIIAFEPDPRARNVYAERFRTKADCTVHPVAVSSHDGTAQLQMAENTIYTSLETYAATQHERGIKVAETREVQTRTLDSYDIDTSRFDRVFLKIDVQGHEIDVLTGAGATLRKADVVLLELSFAPEYEGKEPSFAPACGILHEAGLYPVVFQNYERTLSPYAWERDVIFVKRELLNGIWGW